MERSVLVTGGCGAIGSQMLNIFLKKYPTVRFSNIDCITYSGKESNVTTRENYVLYKGDITDSAFVSRVFEKEKPEIVIHLAAETHVDKSFSNSMEFTKTNMYGTHVLLEESRKHDTIKLFVYMSTDEVYGSSEIKLEESSILAPSNPYSATKASAELLCQSYIHSYNLPIIILRCNNAISVAQNEEKLIPKCINAIKKGENFTVHGDGSARRSFIHTDDITSAIECVIAKGVIGEIYNIGTDDEYTVIQVFTTILDIMKPGAKVSGHLKFIPDRPYQDKRYLIDTSKLEALGWNKKVKFIDALKVLAHQEWST